jgi:DNA-binding NarL/FixJ family response regulator
MRVTIELTAVMGKKKIACGAIDVDVDVREAIDITLDKGTRLTRRETEVRDLMLTGKVHKEIGAVLNLAERTVKYHAANVYRKYGVRDRGALLYKLSKG